MNRRDLFKKLFSKTIDFTVEKGEEIAEAFKIPPSDGNLSQDREWSTPEWEMGDDFSPYHSIDQKKQGKASAKNKGKRQIPDKSSGKSGSNKKNRNSPSSNTTEFLPPGLVYPPGALESEKKFLQSCTGCGDCVFSCPYNAIFPVFSDKNGKNIPYLDVNANACRMCEYFPCIQSCNYGALVPITQKNKLKFGQAKGFFEHCINEKTGEKTCNACEQSCPIDKTVTFRKNKPVFAKSCTGCGLCAQSCPTFPKAIRII